MAKRYTDCGFNSTSKINEGYLAPKQPNSTALLDMISHLDHPDLHLVDLEAQLAQSYPETPILCALSNYLDSSAIKLHIPGHSKGEGILSNLKEVIGHKAVKADTTDDFDGLGQLLPPSGPIKDAQNLAAKAFGVEHTFFLVNGSTVGNLALALTVTKPNKKVLISRNCHRSVVSGLSMTGAVPIWVMPKRYDNWGVWGETTPQSIRIALEENPDISVVWITNPTYEGVVSDIKSISDICKEFNVTLLVDEAHGCLWNFNENLPISAIKANADAVIHSIHKTGGSFSQSSMLHLPYNSKINQEELLNNLKLLQTTSPSYLLLASLDAARAHLESDLGRTRLANMVNFAQSIRRSINKLKGCRCLGVEDGFNIDPTKLYICLSNLSGRQLKKILETEFNIEVEAKTDKGVLALANVGNTEIELTYLYEAIKTISKRKYSYQKERIKCMPFSIPEMVCTPRDASFSEKVKVKPLEAIGRISTEIVSECPPGIPILFPGEKIQLEHLYYLKQKDYLWVTRE